MNTTEKKMIDGKSYKIQEVCTKIRNRMTNLDNSDKKPSDYSNIDLEVIKMLVTDISRDAIILTAIGASS